MDLAVWEAKSMSWREVSVMEQRREFVRLALQDGANRRELCRRFAIHPSTGYKWIKRQQEGGEFTELSRRPHSSPRRTTDDLEGRVGAIRDAHPAWGARKIARCLERAGHAAPALSTIHQILHRTGRVQPAAGGKPASLRFEMAAPNQLWQMDFKGWIRLGNDVRCHPLTVLDDHSRFDLCLQACADQRTDRARQTTACLSPRWLAGRHVRR
jgi:transposase